MNDFNRRWAIRELQDVSGRLQTVLSDVDYRRCFPELDIEQLGAMKVQVDAIVNRALTRVTKASGLWS